MVWHWWRRRTFRGGIFVPDEKAATARQSIRSFTPRGPLLIPLCHSQHLPTRPIAREGADVCCGDVLADPDGPRSLPVLAPLAGRLGPRRRAWTSAEGWLPAIELTPAESSPALPTEPRSPPRTLDELTSLARRNAVLIPEHREPLHVALTGPRPPDVLIIDGLETQPGLTADLRLLVERTDELVQTAGWLADVQLDGRRVFDRVVLTLSLRHRRLVRRVRTLAPHRRLEIAPLEDKYPQSHPTLLTLVITRRRTPPGGRDRDVGVLVIPVATLAALSDAVSGKAPIARVLTVAGEAADRPANLLVPFGTRVSELVEYASPARRPAALIAGGPMTGVRVLHDEAVTTPDLAGLTLLRHTAQPEPTTCIRCGSCMDDCPVGLDPRVLVQFETAVSLKAAVAEQTAVCIDCGVCSYVCPSSLPLALTIQRMRRRAQLERAALATMHAS